MARAKRKICGKFIHPQAITDVDEFVHQNIFGEM